MKNAFFIALTIAIVLLFVVLKLLPNNNTEIDDIGSDTGETSKSTMIEIDSPLAHQLVSNPVELSGRARGPWFFEASAPIAVTNWNGVVIGEGYITATGDWMTEDFVPFTGTVSYTLPNDSYSASGTIVFKRDNPSGLPENDASVEIPVILSN